MSLIGTCMVFFFSSRRRHTIFDCDWSSDVCSSDLYKVQGKGKEAAAGLLADARALEEAGAFAVVLEAIPMDVARTVTEALAIPTIGIGAGPYCDGQVLVLYDLLGLFDEFTPKFVKPYAHLKADALQALRRYREEVEQN